MEKYYHKKYWIQLCWFNVNGVKWDGVACGPTSHIQRIVRQKCSEDCKRTKPPQSSVRSEMREARIVPKPPRRCLTFYSLYSQCFQLSKYTQFKCDSIEWKWVKKKCCLIRRENGERAVATQKSIISLFCRELELKMQSHESLPNGERTLCRTIKTQSGCDGGYATATMHILRRQQWRWRDGESTMENTNNI